MAQETGRVARPIPIAGRSTADDPEIRLEAREILFDREGSLWITNSPNGLNRVRFPERLGKRKIRVGDIELESYGERNGLSGDVSINLLEDREGNIWIGTTQGLDRFRHSHLVPVTLPRGYQRLTLLAGEHGDVWAGSASERPLLRIRAEALVVKGSAEETSSVYRDPRGNIWWGGYGGIRRQNKEQLEYFPQPRNTATDWVWEIFRGDDDGGLWVSLGELGLVHFKDGVWSNPVKPAGLPDRGPSASHQDPSGRIWLGYTENRVYSLDGPNVRGYSHADGLDVGRIKVIRGHGPHLWFGGELGLAVFRNGHFYRVAAAGGEPFGSVSGIVETSDGSVRLNEMRGVVRISADEVRQVVASPSHAVAYQRFDFLDGLTGGPQMNFTVSTVIEGGDGRLWFATDNGLVWIDPAHMTKNNVAPVVAIRSISSGEERHAASDAVKFSSGTKSIEIDYTAWSLSVPERVLFRYQLEGVDTEWQDVSTRRQAFYSNLGPGHYKFRVIACNNDGLWNQEGRVRLTKR